MRPDAMMDATEMADAVYEHCLDDSEEWLAFIEATKTRAGNVTRQRMSGAGLLGTTGPVLQAIERLAGPETLRGSEADLWCYELQRANERNIESKLLQAHDAVCVRLRASGYDLPDHVAERLDRQA